MTEPLVVGEDAARLATAILDVEAIREASDQRNILGRLGEAEMTVHFRGPFEKRLEGVPAECNGRAETDRAP